MSLSGSVALWRVQQFDRIGLELRPEQHLDGLSFAPLLRGVGPPPEREAIYWHYPHYGNQGGTPGASIRSGDWKLIEFFEDKRVELYNLRDDVGEKDNVADRGPELVARLLGMLHEWQDEVSARMPEVNPEFVAWRKQDCPELE